MRDVGDLIGQHGAADARMLRPSPHPGLEESAIDNQLTAALEQIEQAQLPLGAVEHVILLHCHPRHPPPLGGQRVTRASQSFLLCQELLARSPPFLWRDNFRVIHFTHTFFWFHYSSFHFAYLQFYLFDDLVWCSKKVSAS